MKTYQHLYVKCHTYTMYPVWNMHPSILYTPHHVDQSLHPTVLHTHLPDQCAATYPSVVIRIMTPPQYTWTLLIVPEMKHQNPLTMRNHQMRRRTSKLYLWMINIGQQRWYQKEHSAYMRMGYLIMYAHTHALMELMTLPHI